MQWDTTINQLELDKQMALRYTEIISLLTD